MKTQINDDWGKGNIQQGAIPGQPRCGQRLRVWMSRGRNSKVPWWGSPMAPALPPSTHPWCSQPENYLESIASQRERFSGWRCPRAERCSTSSLGWEI